MGFYLFIWGRDRQEQKSFHLQVHFPDFCSVEARTQSRCFMWVARNQATEPPLLPHSTPVSRSRSQEPGSKPRHRCLSHQVKDWLPGGLNLHVDWYSEMVSTLSLAIFLHWSCSGILIRQIYLLTLLHLVCFAVFSIIVSLGVSLWLSASDHDITLS